FQRGVLLFQLFESLGVVGLHTTILIAPPIIGLLSDLKFAAHVSHGFAFPKKAVCLAKFPNYLFRSVALSLSTHRMVHSPRKYGVYGLTYRLDLKNGVRPTLPGRSHTHNQHPQ